MLVGPYASRPDHRPLATRPRKPQWRLAIGLWAGLLGACGDDATNDSTSTAGGSGGSTGSPATVDGGSTTDPMGVDPACMPLGVPIGSCTYTDEGLGLCAEYWSDEPGDLAATLMVECTTQTGDGDGIWAPGGCPSADVQGLCLVSDGGSYQTRLFFYPGGSYQMGDAQIRCDSLEQVSPSISTNYCDPP